MARDIIEPVSNSPLRSSKIRTVLQALLDDWVLDEFTASSTGADQTATLSSTPTGIKLLIYGGDIYFSDGAGNDFTVLGTTLTVHQHMDSGDKFAFIYQKASF